MGKEIGRRELPPLLSFFSVIQDPRVERNRLSTGRGCYHHHTTLAVIALAQGWEDIERYGNAKKEWPGRFLKLEHGIPGYDVYRRVMSCIKPEEAEQYFMNWVRAIQRNYEREVIAIDGKTRGISNLRKGGKRCTLSAPGQRRTGWYSGTWPS